jgi:malonyl-CoA/methylmalonyl-CoA synthetase
MHAWMPHLPEGTADFDPLGGQRSLAGAWKAKWSSDPEAVAIVDLTQLSTGRPVSRGELDRGSSHAATALLERGVKPGDRVLISGAPSLPYVLLYLGAIRLGATIVPANTAYTAPELAHIASDSGAMLAIFDDPARARDLDLPTLVPRELLDSATAAAASDDLDRSSAEDLAMIAYTSGTTGRPKGAMLTHGNLLASALAVVVSWRWTDADGLILALPLFHLHGLGVGLHGSLISGGHILLLDRFSPAAVAGAAGRADATLFFGVPTMYSRLLEFAAGDPTAAAAIGRLRLLVSGSAPLPADLWQRLATVTGQRVLERYGMTETVMNISNPYDGERRPGTVGFPLPGVEVSLGGSDGEMGEILVRGPNVFSGYLGQPDATAAAFTERGWFRTGDIGSKDSDGYISIVGRSKDLIISGGYNVYPREVEDALAQHESVSEVAVIGTESEEWGERVTAFVVAIDPGAPPSEGELDTFVRAHLASYKRPRAYEFVDSLPRNALGKIQRHLLAPLMPSESDG